MGDAKRLSLPLLRRGDLVADPIDQFTSWWEVAQREAALPEAMTLATVDDEGSPDARMVLLKGHGPDGFRFFSNFESRKARQLEAMPGAALILYWRELDRQVRIRGPVERLSERDSDAYFATRPRESRLGAWASPQSRPLADRTELESLLADVRRRFGEGDDAAEIPRPPYWGGYVLLHEEVEFWQGHQARLHDRFVYSREGEGWRIERLGP